MRLIERLRATQDMQRQAYATLEAALVSKWTAFLEPRRELYQQTK
jgi:hypothetical protein